MSGQNAQQPWEAGPLFQILKEEFDHATEMWKKAVTLQYDLGTWIQDTTECAKIWFKGVNVVFGGVLPWAGPGEVPGVVFVVDDLAEQADPQTVLISGLVDPQATLGHELRGIATGKNFDGTVHVERIGLLLKISLQDLTTMDTGHSAGVVFVKESGGAKMPLAHLYVTKLAP